MLLPPLLGNLDQDKFFIYAAADSVYFDLHARPLINSIITNTPEYGVHIHIYNPTQEQISFCRSHQTVTCTYEHVNEADFQHAADYWLTRSGLTNERQAQMYKKGQKLGREELLKLIRQTYYACVRFVRLAELIRPGQRCLSIDVDGLVRSRFSDQIGPEDFYLYEKPKDGTHLAGAILLNGTSGAYKFLQEYADQLRISIGEDDLYWFLDQFILDLLVTKYHKGLLPMSYIDWAMRPESAIWSAKGKRKELDIFKQEQHKYL
jgi:hypothetical protein